MEGGSRKGDRTVSLSVRMQAVADFVPKGLCMADVGCDHGYVSVYLAGKQICPHVIAMDVNPGPLAHARENIREAGLDTYIEPRLSNGLEALSVKDGRMEADGAVIAGMGGRLTVQILSKDPEKTAGLRVLVLQPQSELSLVRRFLREEAGYFITDENMVLEDGKYYQVIQAVNGSLLSERTGQFMWPGTEEDLQLADVYGAFLLQRRHPVLKEFLERERELYNGILGEIADRAHPRLAQIEEKLERNRRALMFWGTKE